MIDSKTLLDSLKKPIPIDQVDFRVQSINNGGYATILAYKDARVDMNRLDEVCGPLWQDTYEVKDNQLFCKIGIKIGSEWIWREDVGTESNTEKEKGRASDAFKRAAFRWGVGRELYEYPLIQVKLRPDEIQEKNGKKYASWNFKLKEWKWNAVFTDGKLTTLTAHDERGTLRFNSSKKTTPTQNKNAPTTSTSNKATKPVDGEKPWLNKMDVKGKEFTKQWLNVVSAINKGTITEVKQVRAHYKVSKETEKDLQDIINYLPQTA